MNKNTEVELSEAEPSSLDLARDAIDYTLKRIKNDPNIRYHMGAFTEAFERLKKAHAALNGISPEAVEQEVFRVKLHRPAAQLINEAKDILNSFDNGYDDKPRLISILRELFNS